MLMVILQVIVLTAVMKMTPKADLHIKLLHTSDWSIPSINHLIRLVTTHDFGSTDSIADEKVLLGYLGLNKNPKSQKTFQCWSLMCL